MPSTTSQIIIVTGANGYLALHVINQLLRRATTCVAQSDLGWQTTSFKPHFATITGGRLTTAFVEDLANPELFREAFDENTVGAIHVASPTHARTEDAVRDMLNPAVKGAIGILEAAKIYASPSFRRVVHLSSTAAITDSKKGPRPGYTYTNSDWNPVTFEEAAAIEDHVSLYVASKALSEKAVWAWMTEHKPKFDLACVNPTMVFGPHLESISNMDEFTSTAKFLWRLVDAAEIPQLMWAGCVDVRDTAAMTVAAFEKHEAGGQRLFANQQSMTRATIPHVPGPPGRAFASKVVIVASGMFNTLELLKLSFIGPAEELAAFDTPLAKHHPGVGTNMHDNYEGVLYGTFGLTNNAFK
ncbi:putative oxidoreductase [Colletotrichum shisoi]|uniref:Putative oxidoreductase n=1 Tax=Colletotrichum shisoi TaxID=2078593 RepID=A0A5Q4BQ21_9PEZI|nr:putative oxidoreductase [Colletotrichum shisoi]